MKSMKASKNVSTIVTYTALVLGSVTMIFPFLWMLLTSFKTQSEAMAIPPKICLLYTSPSPRDRPTSRMPSSA